MSDKITIHKDNDLIHYEPTKKLSLNSLRLLNNLYYHTQKYINEQKEKKGLLLNKDLTIPIKQTTLREWLGLQDDPNYVQKIQKTLKELSDGIEMRNYVDKDGESVLWGLESFIYKPKYLINKEDKKTKIFKVTLDKFMFNKLLQLKSGWTEIDLEYQTTFKSHNTFHLYEYLKSIQNMTHNPKVYIEDLNRLFDTKHKFLSKLIELIKRNLIVINKDTDLKVELVVVKKEKCVMFEINKPKKRNVKQDYKVKQDKEDKQELDNFIKKLSDSKRV